MSPKSHAGRRFWDAVTAKTHGLSKDSQNGYQYYVGKKFPYQYLNE
jgi:hypothetical protein